MTRTESELATITKQVHIDAAPQVVYEVITSPDHIVKWWADEAELEPMPEGHGVLVFRERASTPRENDYVVHLTVVDAVPAERFVFRWVYPDGAEPTATNSMLVTFTLRPHGDATLLTVTEEGMREQGWEAATLEEYYASHENGWTRHLADLSTYVADLVARTGQAAQT